MRWRKSAQAWSREDSQLLSKGGLRERSVAAPQNGGSHREERKRAQESRHPLWELNYSIKIWREKKLFFEQRPIQGKLCQKPRRFTRTSDRSHQPQHCWENVAPPRALPDPLQSAPLSPSRAQQDTTWPGRPCPEPHFTGETRGSARRLGSPGPPARDAAVNAHS